MKWIVEPSIGVVKWLNLDGIQDLLINTWVMLEELSSDSVKNLLIEGRFQSTNVKRLQSLFGVFEPVELNA